MVCHGSDSLPIRPAAEVCSVRGALLKADAGYPERRQEHLFYRMLQRRIRGSCGESVDGLGDSAHGSRLRVGERQNGGLRAERSDGAERINPKGVST